MAYEASFNDVHSANDETFTYEFINRRGGPVRDFKPRNNQDAAASDFSFPHRMERDPWLEVSDGSYYLQENQVQSGVPHTDIAFKFFDEKDGRQVTPEAGYIDIWYEAMEGKFFKPEEPVTGGEKGRVDATKAGRFADFDASFHLQPIIGARIDFKDIIKRPAANTLPTIHRSDALPVNKDDTGGIAKLGLKLSEAGTDPVRMYVVDDEDSDIGTEAVEFFGQPQYDPQKAYAKYDVVIRAGRYWVATDVVAQGEVPGSAGSNWNDGGAIDGIADFDTARSYVEYDVVTSAGSYWVAKRAVAASATLPVAGDDWEEGVAVGTTDFDEDGTYVQYDPVIRNNRVWIAEMALDGSTTSLTSSQSPGGIPAEDTDWTDGGAVSGIAAFDTEGDYDEYDVVTDAGKIWVAKSDLDGSGGTPLTAAQSPGGSGNNWEDAGNIADIVNFSASSSYDEYDVVISEGNYWVAKKALTRADANWRDAGAADGVAAFDGYTTYSEFSLTVSANELWVAKQEVVASATLPAAGDDWDDAGFIGAITEASIRSLGDSTVTRFPNASNSDRWYDNGARIEPYDQGKDYAQFTAVEYGTYTYIATEAIDGSVELYGQPRYNAAKSYKKSDTVISGGRYWTAKRDVAAGTAPVAGDDWEQGIAIREREKTNPRQDVGKWHRLLERVVYKDEYLHQNPGLQVVQIPDFEAGKDYGQYSVVKYSGKYWTAKKDVAGYAEASRSIGQPDVSSLGQVNPWKVVQYTTPGNVDAYSPEVTSNINTISGRALDSGVAYSNDTDTLNLFESTSGTSITNNTKLGDFTLAQIDALPADYHAGGDIYTRAEAIADGEDPDTVTNAISFTRGGRVFYLLKGLNGNIWVFLVNATSVQRYFVIRTPGMASTQDAADLDDILEIPNANTDYTVGQVIKVTTGTADTINLYIVANAFSDDRNGAGARIGSDILPIAVNDTDTTFANLEANQNHINPSLAYDAMAEYVQYSVLLQDGKLYYAQIAVDASNTVEPGGEAGLTELGRVQLVTTRASSGPPVNLIPLNLNVSDLDASISLKIYNPSSLNGSIAGLSSQSTTVGAITGKAPIDPNTQYQLAGEPTPTFLVSIRLNANDTIYIGHDGNGNLYGTVLSGGTLNIPVYVAIFRGPDSSSYRLTGMIGAMGSLQVIIGEDSQHELFAYLLDRTGSGTRRLVTVVGNMTEADNAARKVALETVADYPVYDGFNRGIKAAPEDIDIDRALDRIIRAQDAMRARVTLRRWKS